MRNVGNCPECGAPIREVRVFEGHYVLQFSCRCGVHDNLGSHYFAQIDDYDCEPNMYGSYE